MLDSISRKAAARHCAIGLPRPAVSAAVRAAIAKAADGDVAPAEIVGWGVIALWCPYRILPCGKIVSRKRRLQILRIIPSASDALAITNLTGSGGRLKIIDADNPRISYTIRASLKCLRRTVAR